MQYLDRDALRWSGIAVAQRVHELENQRVGGAAAVQTLEFQLERIRRAVDRRRVRVNQRRGAREVRPSPVPVNPERIVQRVHVVDQLADLHGIALVERRHGRGVGEYAGGALEAQRPVRVHRHKATEHATDLLLEELFAVGFLDVLEANHHPAVGAVPKVSAQPEEIGQPHQRGRDPQVPGGGQRRSVAVQRAGEDRIGELDRGQLEVNVLSYLFAPACGSAGVDVVFRGDRAERAAGAAGERGGSLAGVPDDLVADLEVAHRRAGRVRVGRPVVDGREPGGRHDADGRVRVADRGCELRLGEREEVFLRAALDVRALDRVPPGVKRCLHDLLRADQHEIRERQARIAEPETHLPPAHPLVIREALADLRGQFRGDIDDRERRRAYFAAALNRVEPLRDDRRFLERALDDRARHARDAGVRGDVKRVHRVGDTDDVARFLAVAGVQRGEGERVTTHQTASIANETRIASSAGVAPVKSSRSNS